MKNSWILFLLLLLTLSVYPCSDSEECKTKISTEVSKNTNHEKHNHENEQCPPFFSCACRGVNVFQFQNTVCSFKKEIILYNQKENINFYSFIYNKKIAYKIWQPPQVS